MYDARKNIRAIAASVTFLAFAVAIVLINLGRDLLVPIALSVFVALLLDAMAAYLRRIPFGPWRLPRWLCLTAAVVLIGWAFSLVVNVVIGTIDQMTERVPDYQANIERMISDLAHLLGLEEIPTLSDLIARIDLQELFGSLVGLLSDLAGGLGIIIVYVLFLLAEQQSFSAKMAAFGGTEAGRERITAVFDDIALQIRTYIFQKTVNGVLCAIIAYVVMLAVGLDFAVFWAFLTFVTYYIPTIGSAIALVLPTLMALVQFDTLTEAIIIFAVSGGLQTAVANILEPRMMGRSMNLSPFVIILSLFAWGSVWGMAGMFLCVPLTVIAMIVFSHFPRTWRIAVLLSSDGKVEPPPGMVFARDSETPASGDPS